MSTSQRGYMRQSENSIWNIRKQSASLDEITGKKHLAPDTLFTVSPIPFKFLVFSNFF